MLFIRNDTNIKVKTKKLKEISQNLTKKDVDCLFLSSSKMQELNNKERSIDKTTDVLSFPLEDFQHVPLGSVVINLELAREVSEELGHSLEDECSLLFIHAMLHLLGFDHECDGGEMRKKESELIEKFKLPKSLIERNLDYS